MRVRIILLAVKVAALPGTAAAHVSEQGFVLLLPTGVYSAAGVAVVALTIAALLIAPASATRRAFTPVSFSIRLDALLAPVQALSALAFAFVIWVGLTGSRDPLSNLAPLMVWTVGWICVVSLAGFVGDLGRWLNPWSAIYRLLALRPVAAFPDWLGHWPAVAGLIGIAAFLLADIAPDDPYRLATALSFYWALIFVGMIIFGPVFRERAEAVSTLVTLFSGLAASRMRVNGGLGAPGWRLLNQPASASLAVFALAALGVGSFDGLNETFWWLGTIGVNPLEFPGRSAVVGPTLLGLFAAVALLIATFAATVSLGLALAGGGAFAYTFGRLGLSVLPIALGYHVAHYLTAFLVNIQYVYAALSDPLATGADYLSIEPFYVTTGFFNRLDSVRVIWLSQASAVVIGHVWSVVLAHRIALDLFPEPRRAVLATLPLSAFMIGYTFLGLWLLAAPRGA